MLSRFHLLHILEYLSDGLIPVAPHYKGTYHIAVPIKGLDPRQQFLVVSQRDQHLGMVPNRLLEDGQRSLADLMLLECSQLSLIQLRFWNMQVLARAASRSATRSTDTMNDFFWLEGAYLMA